MLKGPWEEEEEKELEEKIESYKKTLEGLGLNVICDEDADYIEDPDGADIKIYSGGKFDVEDISDEIDFFINESILNCGDDKPYTISNAYDEEDEDYGDVYDDKGKLFSPSREERGIRYIADTLMRMIWNHSFTNFSLKELKIINEQIYTPISSKDILPEHRYNNPSPVLSEDEKKYLRDEIEEFLNHICNNNIDCLSKLEKDFTTEERKCIVIYVCNYLYYNKLDDNLFDSFFE